MRPAGADLQGREGDALRGGSGGGRVSGGNRSGPPGGVDTNVKVHFPLVRC